MSLRFICIEVRENLRCANVFLQFENSLTEIKSLRIKVKPEELLVKQLGQCVLFKLSDYFSLDIRSLSNLAVEKLNASFRFTITNIKCNAELQSSKIVTTVEPLFENGSHGSFVCGTCTSQLMATDTLVRMREFPTGAVDSSEFFCHAATEFKDILVPRVCDLYYGMDFVVVNSELLENTTKQKSGHVYCKRCLQHLGETLFNEKAIKMWSESVKLQYERQDGENIYSDILSKMTTSKLIQKIVDDSTDASEPIHAMNFAKVLLSTSNSNRVTMYLMIHILEKQLRVLRNETLLLHDNNNGKEKKLTEYKSFKLLYRFVQEEDYDNAQSRLPAMLQFWQQDISIQSLKISPNVFTNLLEELEENSSLIPEFYRFNKNDFKLSYVFHKD